MSGYRGGKKYRGIFRNKETRNNILFGFLIVSFYATLFALDIFFPRGQSNRSEKPAGIPSMPNEQQWRNNHHEERPVTILIELVHKNENSSTSRDSAKDGVNKAACVCFDDPVQIRISPGDVDQSSISGAVERKN